MRNVDDLARDGAASLTPRAGPIPKWEAVQQRAFRRRLFRLAAVTVAVVCAGTLAAIQLRGSDHGVSTLGSPSPTTSARAVVTAPGPPTTNAPTGTPAQCTQADLVARDAPAMPVPHVVARHRSFGSIALDPPSTNEPPVSATRAWKIATKFGLLAPSQHGSYELLLGDLTSEPNLQPRTVWMIIGREVPTVVLGGPAVIFGESSPPPRPPCQFGNTLQPIDATTGRSLFYESGGGF